MLFRQRTKEGGSTDRERKRDLLLLHCSNCRNSVNPLVSQLTDGGGGNGRRVKGAVKRIAAQGGRKSVG